jgi:hypothetical protein
MLWLACGLVAFCGFAHSYLGEKFIIPRLLALPDLPLVRRDRGYTERLFRYAWHLTSVYFWGAAVLLALLAMKFVSDPRPVGFVLGGLFFLSGAICLTVGPRHPAWPLFFIAAVLTIVAVW